ncbi:pilus assembly protein [Variovorax paradoxus]|nr:pilus assembly protein [Variovorax paradoxus]
MKSAHLRLEQAVSQQQRGVAAIEFALVFSVLFLGIYGLVTFGGVLYVQQVVSRAAEDGARAAQLSRSDEIEANARTAIYRSLALSMITPASAGTTPSLREIWLRAHMASPDVLLPPGEVEVKVTVTYPYRANPLLPPLPFTWSWMPNSLLGKATATRSSS